MLLTIFRFTVGLFFKSLLGGSHSHMISYFLIGSRCVIPISFCSRIFFFFLQIIIRWVSHGFSIAIEYAFCAQLRLVSSFVVITKRGKVDRKLLGRYLFYNCHYILSIYQKIPLLQFINSYKIFHLIINFKI